MTVHPRERIKQVLWPEGAASRPAVWAILDCARDPRVYRALLASRLDFLCLYSGRLPRPLEMVAPHLVELLPEHRLTATLLEEGWAQCWGVFLTIDDAANLRHHLRKLLTVRDPQGRRLLFRFYDPRVLRAYLPTCTPDEWRQFVGPITALFVEAPAGDGLIEFARDGRWLGSPRAADGAAGLPA
ncbi:MAG: DUF4123 domain-containing protein [Burkholderiales bacterium]|nr:DUF4123 domain-containing protein [Burkholderiales bacterium]